LGVHNFFICGFVASPVAQESEEAGVGSSVFGKLVFGWRQMKKSSRNTRLAIQPSEMSRA
jgi:hypothetical protein